MIDVINDEGLVFLPIALESAPIKPLDLIKQANIEEPFEEYSADVFADPANKQFPIHTPEHTALSAVYLHKQASEAPDYIIENMMGAIENWGLYELAPLLEPVQELQKEASSDIYLLPSKRKFPVVDEQMLEKSASVATQYLNVMPLEERVEVATNLVKTAQEYGYDRDEIPGWALVYGQEFASDLYKVAEALSLRYAASQHNGYKNLMTKIASLKNQVGSVSYDKTINRGIAMELNELDKTAGVYEDFEDAFITVFNDTKIKPEEETVLSKLASEEDVVIGGTSFYKQDLVQALENGYAKVIMGEDLIKEAMSNSMLDTEKAIDLITELPEEAQEIIAQQIMDI